jgi:hypothetical protein
LPAHQHNRHLLSQMLHLLPAVRFTCK